MNNEFKLSDLLVSGMAPYSKGISDVQLLKLISVPRTRLSRSNKIHLGVDFNKADDFLSGGVNDIKTHGAHVLDILEEQLLGALYDVSRA